MNEYCAKGLENAKNLEMLEQRTALMFEKVNEGLEKMDKKLDKLDKKIEALKDSIPAQIEEAVDIKWKSGVYSVVKWLVITVAVAVIGVVVRLVIGG
jgi:hypothetical protein